jgi:hypothetical protein
MASEIGPEDEGGKVEEIYIMNESASHPGRRLAG